jgi:DNA polymerase-3 subunit delta
MFDSMRGAVSLVFGNDEYRVSCKARETIDLLLPRPEQTLGLEVVNAGVDSAGAALAAIGQVIEALLTASFLSTRKVVWFRGVTFLSESAVGRQADVKAKVNDLAAKMRAGLPPGHVLVVTAPAVDKRFAFYKLCKDKGEVFEFAVPENTKAGRREVEAWLGERVRELSLRMPGDVQAVFLDRVGNDSMRLLSEMEKLALLAGKDGAVGREHVDAITSASSESLAWDLADAAGHRDLSRSLQVLNRLLFQRESPIGLVIGLHKRIEDLILYREAIDRGWVRVGRDYRGGSSCAWGQIPARAEQFLGEDLEKDPRQAHPYRSAILAEQARNFSLKELRKCRRAIVEAHEALVSGSTVDSIVLEMMLVKMLA